MSHTPKDLGLVVLTSRHELIITWRAGWDWTGDQAPMAASASARADGPGTATR